MIHVQSYQGNEVLVVDRGWNDVGAMVKGVQNSLDGWSGGVSDLVGVSVYWYICVA